MTTPHPAAATVTSPRRRTALCVAAALMALPVLPACAIEPRPGAQPIEMSVIDRDTGQPLTVYRKAGRAWVAGQPASRYAIRLRNLTKQPFVLAKHSGSTRTVDTLAASGEKLLPISTKEPASGEGER